MRLLGPLESVLSGLSLSSTQVFICRYLVCTTGYGRRMMLFGPLVSNHPGLWCAGGHGVRDLIWASNSSFQGLHLYLLGPFIFTHFGLCGVQVDIVYVANLHPQVSHYQPIKSTGPFVSCPFRVAWLIFVHFCRHSGLRHSWTPHETGNICTHRCGTSTVNLKLCRLSALNSTTTQL